MFSSIDNKIINTYQWTIRQFELYTPIERNDIINFTLSLIKIMMTTFFLLTLVRYFVVFSFLSFVDFNFLFMLVFTYKEWKKIHQRNKSNELLPKEIITRERHRMFSTLFFTLVLFLSFLVAFTIFTKQENQVFTNLIDLIILFQGACLCLLIVLMFFIEYLLCTISLPPGEKEKRNIEKEMKNLIPQKISG